MPYPVLDLKAALEKLENDDEILREVLVEFRRSTPQLIDELAAAIMAGNSREAMRLSHSLKSSSRTVGGLHLGELSSALELQTSQNDLSAAQAAVEEIRKSYHELVSALDSEGF